MSGWQYDHRIAAKTRELLVEKFPGCFAPGKAPKKPLKLGIFDDIRAALPDLAGSRISKALRSYTNGPTYLNSIVENAARIDLAGKPAGKVTADEAADAARRSLGVSSLRRMEREHYLAFKLLRQALANGAADHIISKAPARAGPSKRASSWARPMPRIRL
jgi:sRNA-binding protein